jgi:polysaccharide deacetylase family protein (PEP-CTERM system associated)
MTTPRPTTNIFTVNLEEWCCVPELRNAIDPRTWPRQVPRVQAFTGKLLDMLDRHRVRATFFVSGFVASRYPDLVTEVGRRGHEVACAGYSHAPVSAMQPAQFEEDLERALTQLAGLVSRDVVGYRAPGMSLTRNQYWALTVLARHGIRYDASVLPLRRDAWCGIEDAPTWLHHGPSNVVELPLTCVEVGSWSVPVGGEGSLRRFPYPVVRALLRRHNAAGQPIVFSMSPWELDATQPRVGSLGRGAGRRVYAGRARMLDRLDQLLGDFRFSTARGVLGIESAAVVEPAPELAISHLRAA